MKSSASTHESPVDRFVTTRWTMILSAARNSSPNSAKALADLCQSYWYPLYAFVRRQGYSREDAEDLVQGFFARLMEADSLAKVSAEKGRFRAFLLASMKHFTANEWDRSQRIKRGGGVKHLSLDWQAADDRFHLDPPDPITPDQLYDREWALALLEQVVTRLQCECEATGKSALFEQAKGYLMLGESVTPYADASARLGIDEGAVRVAVHRLRKRYRELLRESIAQTLDDPAQVADELQSLLVAISR
jgi:RNA polymerase sigma-70 factor (ECF subfamily)